jgi:glyoxylase-like metal-dependent hydrolase (beta-lactamase superfamily II)
MKSFLLSILLFHSLLSFEYALTPQKVSKDITCFFGEAQVMDAHNNGNIVNSCYVDLGTSYLVVDTGPSYNYARDTYKAMQKIKNQKVSFVVITHIHDDHWLGNGFYKEQGATILGPEIFATTPKAQKTRMQMRIAKEAYAGTEQVYPSELIYEEKEMTFDGVKAILKPYKIPNHSPNDMIISMPSKSVVFAGDLVFNDRILSLRDGDINNWIETLHAIESYKSDYIIGGHGRLVSKEAARISLAYLEDVKTMVQGFLDEGIDIAEAMEQCDMPKYKELKLYEMMHKGNVEKAYRTLEWEQ